MNSVVDPGGGAGNETKKKGKERTEHNPGRATPNRSGLGGLTGAGHWSRASVRGALARAQCRERMSSGLARPRLPVTRCAVRCAVRPLVTTTPRDHHRHHRLAGLLATTASISPVIHALLALSYPNSISIRIRVNNGSLSFSLFNIHPSLPVEAYRHTHTHTHSHNTMSRPSTSQPTDPYASEAARTEAVDHPLLGSPRTSTDDLPAHSPSQTPASSSSSTAAPTHNAQVYFDAGQALDAHPDRLYDASQPGSAVSGEPSSSAPSAPSASLDSLSPPPQPRTRLDTVRLALGKFGRFVGMRVPGAFYTSVSQADDDGSSHHPRRRVVGSGLGQDGVFSNMNAKPERRRRRQPNAGMEGDRGEDDDLVRSLRCSLGAQFFLLPTQQQRN